jgi:hypothetical protein
MRTFVIDWVAYEPNLKKYTGTQEIIAEDDTVARLECSKLVRLIHPNVVSVDVIDMKKKGE